MKRASLDVRKNLLDVCWRAIYNARAATWKLRGNLVGGGHMPQRKKFDQLINEAELLLWELKELTGIEKRNKLPKLKIVKRSM